MWQLNQNYFKLQVSHILWVTLKSTYDCLSIATLKKICQDYYKLIVELETSKIDVEFEVDRRDLEVGLERRTADISAVN